LSTIKLFGVVLGGNEKKLSLTKLTKV